MCNFAENSCIMISHTLPLDFLADPLDPEIRKKEKLPAEVFKNSQHASRVVAEEIASLIRQRQGLGKMAVLGLATGSTPIRVYDELVPNAPRRRTQFPQCDHLQSG